MPVPQESIQFEQTGNKGRYFYKPSGDDEAELTFSRAGDDLIILDHTGVPDVFRGQGVGQALVTRAVEDARQNGHLILPLCPFAAAQFRRHPEWEDVLKS